jgi:hypothetical protein
MFSWFGIWNKSTIDLTWVLVKWNNKFLTCYFLQLFSFGRSVYVFAQELSTMHRTLGAFEKPWYDLFQVFPPLYMKLPFWITNGMCMSNLMELNPKLSCIASRNKGRVF